MSLFHQSYLLHLLFSFDAFFFYLILLLTGFVPLSIRNFAIFNIYFLLHLSWVYCWTVDRGCNVIYTCSIPRECQEYKLYSLSVNAVSFRLRRDQHEFPSPRSQNIKHQTPFQPTGFHLKSQMLTSLSLPPMTIFFSEIRLMLHPVFPFPPLTWSLKDILILEL